MKPTVRVLAYTQFLGVPDELMPPDREEQLYDYRQDRGSDLARLSECAGRTCYDSYGKGRGSDDYHKHILDVGHGSVLAHSSITFYIETVSRGLTHEQVRHAIGVGISQRSTRYVDESDSPWIWHPLIEASEFPAERLEEARSLCGEVYREVVSHVMEYLEDRGVDKLTARKQARGAARGVLGNALETALVWTANIRALRHVIEERATEFADAEIRLLANALLEAARTVCPEYFSDYERVECPDGIGYGVVTKHRKV